VHAHNYHALPALAAGVSARQRLVFTPHYHGASDGRIRTLLHAPYRLVAARTVMRARRIICVSAAEERLLLRRFPDVAERVCVIPNGVDAQFFAGAEPFASPGHLVLSVGRIEPHKRVDRILDALAALPEPYWLAVIGDGSASPSLHGAVRDRGLLDRVQLKGQVPRAELARWYRTASVFVSMSELEAMGIALLEALAAGTPVVASDIPAHRYVAEITEGAVSLVPPTAAAAAVSAAIEVAANAVPRAARLPSWDDVTDATEAVYEAVARGSDRRS
jgi:glycosyltransferase involved in cell wall biosynthesis